MSNDDFYTAAEVNGAGSNDLSSNLGIGNEKLLAEAIEVGNKSFALCNKSSTNSAYQRKVMKYTVIFLFILIQQDWCDKRQFQDGDTVTESKVIAWLDTEIIPMVKIKF